MNDLTERCATLPRCTFGPGETIVEQHAPFGAVMIVVDGAIAVERDGVTLAVLSERGAIVGEMSTVLGRPSTATLRAVGDTTVLVAEDGAAFLLERPDVLLEVARALATRLDNLTGHLTDVKRQYDGVGGHLEMIDDILGSLLHHQARPVTSGSARLPDPHY